MKRILALSIVMALVTFTSCRKYTIRGEGPNTTDVRYLSDVYSVEVWGDADVEIVPSNKNKVVVSGYENLLASYETYVNKGKLTLKFKDAYFNVRNNNLKITVYINSISDLYLNGSGNIIMRPDVYSNDMNTEINGSGNITIEDNHFDVLHCKVNGSGNIDSRYADANEVYARISGSGDIDVTVNDFLDAHISGSGDISYWGYPETVNVDISGSGKVRRK